MSTYTISYEDGHAVARDASGKFLMSGDTASEIRRDMEANID